MGRRLVRLLSQSEIPRRFGGRTPACTTGREVLAGRDTDHQQDHDVTLELDLVRWQLWSTAGGLPSSTLTVDDCAPMKRACPQDVSAACGSHALIVSRRSRRRDDSSVIRKDYRLCRVVEFNTKAGV